MRRLSARLAVWLVVGPLLAGCSMPPQFACPAIGWVNTLTVVLEGPVQNVHTVELCMDGTCSVSSERSDEPLRLATAMPQETAPSAPTSTPPLTPPIASQVDDHTWRFSLMMNVPKAVTVRALSNDGATIAQREVAPNWKRVGGTEQCGGPVEAPVIRLVVPEG